LEQITDGDLIPVPVKSDFDGDLVPVHVQNNY
jgi:hypothetical protein